MAYDFSEHDYKEDCYWYDAVQDMGAHIPTCLKQGILGSCPCNECKDVKDIKDGENNA